MRSPSKFMMEKDFGVSSSSHSPEPVIKNRSDPGKRADRLPPLASASACETHRRPISVNCSTRSCSSPVTTAVTKIHQPPRSAKSRRSLKTWISVPISERAIPKTQNVPDESKCETAQLGAHLRHSEFAANPHRAYQGRDRPNQSPGRWQH